MICRLFDGGHTPVSGEFLKLENIVAGHHAIRRARKFYHTRLGGDVRSVVGIGESGAGHMRRQVPVKIAIVRGQNERRISLHPQILRSVGVPRAGVRANARENFHVVAVHQTDAPFSVQLH